MVPQRREQTEKNMFGKRLRIIKTFLCLCFILVLSNLVKIQVINSHVSVTGKYARLEIPVPRGTVYDRNGNVLAMSVPFYSLYLDSWRINHHEKREPDYRARLQEELSSVLDMDDSEIRSRIAQRYPLIRRELSVREYLELSRNSLPGTVFEKGYRRIYPNDKLACHVLGFAGRDGEGLEGIEFHYNGLLQGEKGVSLVLRDGEGSLIHSLEKTLARPKPGKDLYLTIDANLQFIVEEELEKAKDKYNAASVSAIVLDYETGEVLAMANFPGYNPNQPGLFSPSDRRNRVLTDLFEPGSTFKIVTAAAAIEEGVFSSEDIIHCENGKWFVRNRYLRDVRPHEELTVSQVIEKSSNIGTVKMAMELGELSLYDYCTRFGFGMPTGIDMPGEIRGILRQPENWSGYSIMAVPIGQEVGANAMQVVRAMSVVANGGRLITPHILMGVASEAGRDKIVTYRNKNSRTILSRETSEIIANILQEASSQGGTAPLASIPGYNISGKTGTAQKIVDGRYSKTDFIASFVGFLNDPRANIIIMVKIDSPRPVYYGGLVAAPVFRNILWRTLQYWNIPPTPDISDTGKIVLGEKATGEL